MSDPSPADRSLPVPLRVWPAVIIVAAQWLIRFALPVVAPEMGLFAMLGGVAGLLLVVLWWLAFSRARAVERVVGVVAIVGLLALTPRILHESLATAGQGVLFFIYAAPVLSLGFVAWAVMARGTAGTVRLATMVVAIAASCGVWAAVRTSGVTGSAGAEFAWRWAPTPEQQLLADTAEVPVVVPAVGDLSAADVETAWPGFRGAGRDSVVPGVRLDTDWAASPPRQIWRRGVGPGWSSFAVRGATIYTQEQRGADEVVTAYDLATGAPVWLHADATRFWEANAGAGPRATPTLHGDRLYALGATGTLNALDANTGAVHWSRDIGADTGVAVPMWGFSSSPLIADSLVIVAAAGRLAAYDMGTGETRWTGRDGGGGYSSPQLLTLGDQPQVVFLSGAGAVSVAPEDGRELWRHDWRGSPIVQPARTADGDVLVSTGGDLGPLGIRRLGLERSGSSWQVSERWTSIRLKPYFNDFVIHGGHAYGFDGGILAAIDLETGERAWKGGRYGHGQLVLLPDQDLLLVITEDGDLALVSATPDGFQELARQPALNGKTWNHPVVVDDVLLVRNDHEMAAFRLQRASN